MLLPFAIVMIRAGLDGHCEVGQKSQMATNRNNTIDYDNRPRTPNVTSWQAVMCDQWLSTPLRFMKLIWWSSWSSHTAAVYWVSGFSKIMVSKRVLWPFVVTGEALDRSTHLCFQKKHTKNKWGFYFFFAPRSNTPASISVFICTVYFIFRF